MQVNTGEEGGLCGMGLRRERTVRDPLSEATQLTQPVQEGRVRELSTAGHNLAVSAKSFVAVRGVHEVHNR